jgi:hypothetical protein
MPDDLKGPGDIPPNLRDRIAKADVLIHGCAPANLRAWAADAKILSSFGAKRIVVVGEKNFGWNMNAVMHLPDDLCYSYRAEILPSCLQSNRETQDAVAKGEYVDLLGMLVGSDGRVPVFTEDRKLISPDREHLTKDGARYVGARLFQHPLLRELR